LLGAERSERSLRLLKALLSSLVLLAAFEAMAQAQTGRVVNAKEANGTYRYGHNEIKILALGHNKLRVSFDLTYEYKSPMGPQANEGSADGEATIENDVAVFHSSEFNTCTITIKFLKGNRIRVTQNRDQECGFGNRVWADGTYAKRSNKAPSFDDRR